MKLTAKQKKKLAALTPFQRKVLLECAKIPKGEAITYAELARRIGKPHSARAVGNALAKNPLAPVIPCHRVVRSDGKLGGYSAKGGQKTKVALLERECGLRLRGRRLLPPFS
ncbi:MAG: MGMT family protein [Candidatus Micrarchaeota archaeon]|nr:MGMT family protein [Candidatus Micrarchaeota archaeon]